MLCFFFVHVVVVYVIESSVIEGEFNKLTHSSQCIVGNTHTHTLLIVNTVYVVVEQADDQ